MNKMKMSAIVLGLAAAGAFAQAPAAAAPAAAPAKAEVSADSVKAAEAAKAQATQDSIKAAEEAKAKAEQDSIAAAEAKKAEEEKAAAEAKKAEEEKAAAEAKKAEEEKAAEAAPAENTNPGEVANAAGNAMDALKASMSEGTSKAQMEVKMSGEVELDAYTDDLFADGDLHHEYATTVDLNFDIKFNEKWSAYVGLEADAASDNAEVVYNGAYIQYQPADFFSVKVGDLTFSEGAFQAYYGYDDPADNAAGMKEHDIRGLQIQLAGLELGIGFGRNDNDLAVFPTKDAEGDYTLAREVDNENAVYDAHVAYEFNYAGQHLRPYFDYKSYQEAEHNEMHAGIDAGLNIGGFSFRAVYGFHADYLADDGDVDMTSVAHTILAEPSFEVSIFQIKTTFFYAFLSNNDIDGNELVTDVPEYMFAYAEPTFKFAEFIKIGIPVEFHTNTLDDDADISTLDLGARVYVDPVENLSIMATGMFDIPVGDNNDEDDTSLRLGVEMVYDF